MNGGVRLFLSMVDPPAGEISAIGFCWAGVGDYGTVEAAACGIAQLYDDFSVRNKVFIVLFNICL